MPTSTEQPPSTLPADFSKWDAAPPDKGLPGLKGGAATAPPSTLPKDFNEWDGTPTPKLFAGSKLGELKELPPEPEAKASPQQAKAAPPTTLPADHKAWDLKKPQQNTLRAGQQTPWQAVESAFGRTQVGQVVESNLDQLGRMWKSATEKANNPLAGTDEQWAHAQAEQAAFFEKHLGTTGWGGAAAGVATGAAEFAEEMTSPTQIMLLAGTFGESSLVQAAQKLGVKGAVPAAKTIAKLAQLQFATQMIEGTATAAENGLRAAWNGDWEGAGKNAIEGLASGLMAKGIVSHEMAQEKVHRDLDATAQQTHGKTFDQLNPFDQGLVIDATVKKSPEYQEVLKTAEEQQAKGKQDTVKQRQNRLNKYYANAISQAWQPDAAKRAIDGLQRAGEEDQRRQAIQDVVKTIKAGAERRAQAIQDTQDGIRQEGREERPERRQAAAAQRSERQKLAGEIAEKREQVLAQRQEAQQAPSDVAQRTVEAVQDDQGNVKYPANYWGEENSFGATADVAGHGIYRETPRGYEWLDVNGNFTEDPSDIYISPDPHTADTIARLSSLSTTADSLADAEGATPEQKADAEKLASIRRDLITGDIDTKEAQRQAGIAEKVTLSDEYTAARDGQLTGPFHESSHAEYLEKLEKSIRDAMEQGDTGWEEADVKAVLDESLALARQQTENNLHHVSRPGDFIVSKRGIRWTLDAKGMLHPDDGGPAIPLMRDGLYGNQATQLAESGRIGYGGQTREERRMAAAKRREVEEAIRRSQDEVSKEMTLAKQAEGLQLATGAEPRADTGEKAARERRRMSRPPRAPEGPESQIVRMIFQAPSNSGSVIQSIARAKETTPEEVMRLSLATDPAMSGTPEQKIAGLEPGDRIVEPIRKKPWVVEIGKDGQTYLRSGNAQPLKLDRVNPTDAIKGIIARGEIEKDQTPADAEKVAFENPHYVRWQDEQVAEVEDLEKKPLPPPVTEKQKAVRVQAAVRRADAAISVATKATVEALDPKTESVEDAQKAVEKANEIVETAKKAYGQAVAARAEADPKDAFPQRAPISIGLRGDSGVIVQNGREVPFHFELIPVQAPIASHEWQGERMVENPRYPSSLQPRTISESKSAKHALKARRGKYDIRQLTDKTINASMGPPVLEPGGYIVSGNTRENILRKHIEILEATPDVEERQALLAGLKAIMRRHATESGISRYPEDGVIYQVARVMDEPIKDTREAAELGRLFNKKIGNEIDETAMGISYSKSLDKDVLREIGRLVDAHDSIAEAIRKEPDYFNKIVTDRFDVGEEEEANWFREVGSDEVKQTVLSEDGRSQFEKAVLGVFIKDPSLLNKLEGKTPFVALQRSLSYLVKMLSLPHMDITGKIAEAFQAAGDTDSTDPGLSRHSDKWAATYRPDQQDFLGMEAAIPPEPDRMVEVLWRALNAGNRTINDRLKSFIGEESAAAISMFEAHQETPTESFNRAFRKEFRQSKEFGGGIDELTPDQFQAALENRELSNQGTNSEREGGRGEQPEQPEGQETALTVVEEKLIASGYTEDQVRAMSPEEKGRLYTEITPKGMAPPPKESRFVAPAEPKKKGMTRPPKGESAEDKLAAQKAAKGHVTPDELRAFLETNPATKDHAPELLRTAKLMAEYVYDADPPVGTERKDALDWVLRERLAGVESGELKSARGQYSDPNVEKGFGDGIMRLHKAADPSTFIHEFAHVIFPLLSDEDLRTMNRIIGDTRKYPEEWDGQRSTLKGKVYQGVSEKFAHGLEQFLRDENPTGFTHEVKAVLAKIKDIMRKVYLSFRGDPLSDFQVGEAQREVFAKMFGITDFDVADSWREEVKKARAEEKRLKKPDEEKHPLVKLASEMGATGIKNAISGKVEDTVGERVDPRKPSAVATYNKHDAVMAAWSLLPTPKIPNAELIEGEDGEWGIRFNTKMRVPPDILMQELPARHPGLELEDLQKRLRETPAHKFMERKLLQVRVDTLRNKIRSDRGVEEAAPKTEEGLAKAVAEEVKRGREPDSVRKPTDGVPGDQKPKGAPTLPKRGIMGLPRHAGAASERGGPAREPVAGVRSLAEVNPVNLVPLAKERGAPVGTVRGKAFDEQAWKASLKVAMLPESMPAPTYALDPKTAQVLKFPGQKQIVQAAMSALEQGDGFVVASTTGTGKTYTSMGITWEFRSQRPDAKILHITKNRSLLKEAVKVAANSYGMEVEKEVPDSPEVEPGVYATTYIGMLNNPIYAKVKWDLVQADESGEARNWFQDENKQGKALIDLVNNSDKAVYYSATPFHSPMEYGYLTKLNLWQKGQFDKWIQQNFAHEKIGDKIVARLDPSKQAKLRQQLIERGQLVSQGISYEGYTAHFGVVPVTDATKRSLDRIREGFARARDQFVKMGKKGMAEKAAAFEATYTKAFLERERIPQAIELANRAREKGWHVMIFSETSAEDLFRRERADDIEPSTYQQLDDAMGGTLSKIIPPFEDVYDRLREEWGSDVVDYSGRGNTMASRDAAKRDFLTGKAPLLYSTYAAGGIGVSLHDADYPDLNVIGGDKPRLQINLGPPYSGVLLEQAMGRPWRFGVKSDVIAVFLATDSEPDIHLMQTKIGPRMKALRAAVHGENDSLANVMQSYTDEQKVRERQDMMAYAEGDEMKVTAANYQVRSKKRTVGINDWSQINFPQAADAMNRGMKYGEEVPGSDWSNMFQSKPGMYSPDSPENAAGKKVIDTMANAAVSGNDPAVNGLDPADRQTATAVASANATAEVDVPADRDKDNTARQSMEANLREGAFIPYQGLMLTQEQGMVNIARMDRKPEVGYELRRMNRSYRAEWDTGVAQSWNMLEDSMKRYGLKPDDDVMRQIWDVVEGKKVSDNPKIMSFATDISDMMAVVHDDLATAGVSVNLKGGEKVPYTDFPRDPHYMPHRIDWDYEMVDPETGDKVKVKDFLKIEEKKQQRILDSIPELRPYSRSQVLDYLRRNDPRAPMQSNIHFAREVNFPFIKKDYATLLGYFDQAAQAISAARNFGPEEELLNGAIKKIDNPTGQATLNSMFRAALHPQNWQGATAKIYNAAVAYEAASKMTFSAFKVPFHLVLGPVALKGRILPHIQAFSRLALHPMEVMENAAYVGTIARQSSAAEMMFGEHMNNPVRQILRREMFESAYKMVRVISGESARVYLEQYALRDLKKGGTAAENTRRMLKDVFLIGDHGIDEAIKNRRFSPEDMAKGQTAFTNLAAFSGSGDPLQMPGMARLEMPRIQATPQTLVARAIRLTYALQSFSVKATSLLRENLWDEVMVHGNKKPLMYAIIAFPIVGTMLNLTATGAKHAVQRGLEGATGKKHKEDSWDKYIKTLEDIGEHPDAVKFLKWYVDSWALSAGMEMVKTLSDPMMNIAMGKPAKADSYWLQDMLEHVAGPFFTDLYKTGEEVVNLQKIHAGKTHLKDKGKKYERSLLKYATEEVPALREIPWVSSRTETPKKKGR